MFESLETVTLGIPAPEAPVPVATAAPPNCVIFSDHAAPPCCTGHVPLCTAETDSVPLATVQLRPVVPLLVTVSSLATTTGSEFADVVWPSDRKLPLIR